jgi:hypothetical protein
VDVQGLPALPLPSEHGAGLLAGLLLPLWVMAVAYGAYAVSEARWVLRHYEGERGPIGVGRVEAIADKVHSSCCPGMMTVIGLSFGGDVP